MIRHDQTDLSEQALKLVPAAAGTVATAITLSEWVGIVTITYVVIQAVYLVWKASWERQERIEARQRAIRQEEREERALCLAEIREDQRKKDEAVRELYSSPVQSNCSPVL